MKLAEIPCPLPVLLRSHVLVMSFIGKDGRFVKYNTFNVRLLNLILMNRAAPRLKDAEFSEDKARELYLDMIKIMRKLYHQCRLVHADLSEYNILYLIAFSLSYFSFD